MFCVDCGTKNPADARFCKQCGRHMEDAGPADAKTAPTHAAALPEDLEAEPIPEEDRPRRARELLSAAFRRYEEGEIELATSACRESLELQPHDADAHALMSTLHEKAGAIEQAIEEREKVLELSPTSIADREKLAMLRAGVTQVAKRTIISSHETPPRLFDTPAGAALGAFTVTLLVVVVGGAAMWWRDGQRTTPSQVPVLQAAPQPATGQQASSGVVPAPAARSQTTTRPQPPLSQPARGPDYGSMVPVGPAPVTPAPGGNLERDPRWSPPARNGDGSPFFMPDRESPPAARPDPSATPSGGTATPAPPNPGRIEIVVSPSGGAGSRPNPGNVGPNTPPNVPSASMESRAKRAVADSLYEQGDFARAAAAYGKALDSAGDDSSQVHQLMAQCYQNLKQNDRAIQHYREAITSYGQLKAAGRGTPSIDRAIRSCEAGVKACQ